jgi:hypothetical protein
MKGKKQTIVEVVDGGPQLSHHAAGIVDDDILVLVGGWNGRHRTRQERELNMNNKEYHTGVVVAGIGFMYITRRCWPSPFFSRNLSAVCFGAESNI